MEPCGPARVRNRVGRGRARRARGGECRRRRSPYSLQVSALTGPQGGLLRIEVDAEAPAPAVETLKFVQVSVNGRDDPCAEEVESARRDRRDRARAGCPRSDGQRSVHVRSGTHRPSSFQLRRAAIARLRPDLVVAAVHAPPQTLTTRPIDVVADVSELNGDVGAKATLTLMLGPTPVAEPKTVTVPKGGGISSSSRT